MSKIKLSKTSKRLMRRLFEQMSADNGDPQGVGKLAEENRKLQHEIDRLRCELAAERSLKEIAERQVAEMQKRLEQGDLMPSIDFNQALPFPNHSLNVQHHEPTKGNQK